MWFLRFADIRFFAFCSCTTLYTLGSRDTHACDVNCLALSHRYVIYTKQSTPSHPIQGHF